LKEKKRNKLSNPKRHHFLPKVYLKNFCENGFFWVYDRKKNEYRKQTPNNTAVQKKYYSFIGCDGKEHNEIENKVLSDIETEVKPIIDKINNKKIISPYEKMILAIFITFLHLRGPGFEKEMNDIFEKFIKIYAKFTFSTEENTNKKLIDFVNKENYKVKAHRVFSLKMMYELAQELPMYFIQMDWQFCYSPKTSLFITSDTPFVLIPPNSYKKCELGRLGMISRGTKKIVPLTQKVCLILSDKGEKVEKSNISSKKARELNFHIAKNCDNLLISRDKSLLEELVKITNIDKFKANSKVEMVQNGSFIIMHKK